jgi:hypothetical protein
MRSRSNGVVATLPRADADGVIDGTDEDLAIANAPGASRLLDCLQGPFELGIFDNNLDFYLGQEVHNIFGAAIKFSVAFLPPESFGLNHSNALDANFMQGVLHFIEFERLDDGFDFFH